MRWRRMSGAACGTRTARPSSRRWCVAAAGRIVHGHLNSRAVTGKRARQHLRQGNEEAETDRDGHHPEGADRVGEPVLTCKLSSPAKELVAVPMIVSACPANSQGVQRVVKEVTAASAAVFGFERRDGFIRGRAAHRELMLISQGAHANRQ